MITALQAGKRLCYLSRWTLTNQRLQNILYIAHMMFMGKTDGDRLVIDSFEATDFGPVAPELSRRVDVFGARPIKNVFRAIKDFADTEREDALTAALSACIDLSPAKLISITHCRYSAWAKNYIPGIVGVTIPNDDILAEYAERFKSA